MIPEEVGNTFDICEKTIEQLQSAMKEGIISSREIIGIYLDRMKLYDMNGPELKSIITINSEATETADNLDKERKNRGLRSALHGIPVILKDCIDTVDMPTTGGAIALENSIPLQDSFLVGKLKKAGAIILAKANLHELVQGGTTLSPLGGQTLNPYDTGRTPGGSSGGTAVAVAANFAVAGMGTDTVNSVRSPASSNSLVGLRPTLGLLSRDGLIPNALTMDTAGPITRTVADAAILLDVLAGYDENDPVTAWSINQVPKSYASYLNIRGLQKSRLAFLENFSGSGKEHMEVNSVIKNAIEELRSLGAEVISFPIPGFSAENLKSTMGVQVYESFENLGKYLSGLRSGFPIKSVKSLLDFGKLNPDVEKRLKDSIAQGNPLESLEYKERLIMRQELKQTVMKIMADNKIDAFIYPHQKQLVCRIGEKQLGRNGILAALTGFPAITVPAGFSKPTKTAPIGIPIGIEFLGRPWSEGRLIELTYSYEQETKHRKPPVFVG